MVLENEYCTNSVSGEEGERRSVESRQLSYQKIQESNGVAKTNKRARESSNNCNSGRTTSGNDSKKGNGSWGPVFQNRQNFNEMHLF